MVSGMMQLVELVHLGLDGVQWCRLHDMDGLIHTGQCHLALDDPKSSADQVRQYAEAAFGEGLAQIEEISVNTSGHVEVEGYDDSNKGEEGEELSVHFRLGDAISCDVRRE